MSLLSDQPEPGYGLAEAARICGVSKPTVRRRKAALVRAGAVADETGWVIPPRALVAVGLLEGVPEAPVPSSRSLSPVTRLPVAVPATPADTPAGTPAGAGDVVGDARVAALEAEVAVLRERLAAAEARAEERDRCLRTLETALAGLAGPGRSGGRGGSGARGRRTPEAGGVFRSPSTWTHPTAP